MYAEYRNQKSIILIKIVTTEATAANRVFFVGRRFTS